VGFENILIPVDFSCNTDIAIKKAIEISNSGYCRLHLVHIMSQPARYFVTTRWRRNAAAVDKFREKEVERKLNEWKACVERNAPNIQVETSIIWDCSIQNSIVIKAGRIKADLIVIGKRMNHPWLTFMNTISPSVVKRRTSSAVLTVKIGSLNTKIKNIIVPVNEAISVSKMNAIHSLCRKRAVKIFLVSFVNGANAPEKFSALTLLEVQQWIRTNLHCEVEYAVLHGHDKTKSILRFSEKQKADILLLNSRTETRIGWLNRHISDVIPASSKVQLLTV